MTNTTTKNKMLIIAYTLVCSSHKAMAYTSQITNLNFYDAFVFLFEV